ncbi:hypothetical protein V6M83_01980 [Streptococcus anginosus]
MCVNDGSTDRSEEIIKEYAAKYPFIELFSKVFVAPQVTTILVYHLLLFLSIPFFIFFYFSCF